MSDRKEITITRDNIESFIMKAGNIEIQSPDGSGWDCKVIVDGNDIAHFITKMNVLIEANKSIVIDFTIDASRKVEGE